MELVTSRNTALFLKKSMGEPEVEELWAIALTSHCQVIKTSMLFRGTVDSCFIHPRDIFRFSLLNNASFLLVGHNHPSGNCQPSPADKDLTQRLRDIGGLLQIPLLDHVIVTKNNYYSFAEFNWRGRAAALTRSSL